jgi:hypothetical protein
MECRADYRQQGSPDFDHRANVVKRQQRLAHKAECAAMFMSMNVIVCTDCGAVGHCRRVIANRRQENLFRNRCTVINHQINISAAIYD